MKTVVTGAAGFIASHLTDTLLALGHEVVAVDKRCVLDDVIAAGNLRAALAGHDLRFQRLDLVESSLDDIVSGADVVFHLAALPGVRDSWGSRFADYVTANIVATDRLLASCERVGVRKLVYASSSSVYGCAAGPSREDGPTGPLSPYGVTKLAAEHLCLAHAHRPDTTLTVAALRYFTVYGPRQRPDMAINRILLAALSGTPVPLFGDGRQRREFTFIDDVVAATVAAGHAPERSVVANVGGGASTSILDVADRVARLTGRRVPTVAANRQAGDVAATQADLTQARRLLGYRPTVGLDDGLQRHLQWLIDLPDVVRRHYLPEALEKTSC